MNIIELVSSVSKIAIGAFLITLIVVGYEVFLLMRRKKDVQEHHDENIVLPEFTSTVKEGTFSPVAVGTVTAQPLKIQSRKLSKPFLGMLLGLLILIVLGTGYLVYRRNQVASVKVDEVSPLAQARLTPSAQPLPTQAPLPTSEPSDSPTPSTHMGSVTGTVTGTVTGIPTGVAVFPTSIAGTNQVTGTAATISPTSTTAAAPTTTLPQAGSYQTTLIISLVSIAIIYLALIL